MLYEYLGLTIIRVSDLSKCIAFKFFVITEP